MLLASDANSQVQLHVGDRFVLLLGEYRGTIVWNVHLSTTGVLQRVGDSGQGVYQAALAGQTELTATGDAACRTARPPCMVASRVVRYTIVVS